MSAVLQPDVFETLRTGYRSRLRDKLSAFRRYEHALVRGDNQAEGSIRDLAHQVAGSGGSYGFLHLSVVAREAERASTDDLSAALATLLDTIEGLAAG